MEVSLKSLAEFLFQRRCLKEIKAPNLDSLSQNVSNICIDSRHVQRGALFVALMALKEEE